jgi:ketosteroid isomerase-like protein
MPNDAERALQEIVDRESRAWDSKNVELLLSIFHPDMVWPWPPTSAHHDPVDWVFWAGRFHRERWRKNWQDWFDTHELVHNRRSIVKIVVTPEADGGFVVVDVDTLLRDRSGREQHWMGRACKVYSLVNGEWKMTMHTGLLEYPYPTGTTKKT